MSGGYDSEFDWTNDELTRLRIAIARLLDLGPTS